MGTTNGADQENDLSAPSHWDGVYGGMSTTRPRPSRLRTIVRHLRRRKFNSILRRFTSTLPSRSAKVLELGCAPGQMLELLYDVEPRACLFGIDFSAEGVSVARQRLNSAGIDARIIEGDFRSVDIEADFSLVVSFGLIEHFDDPVPILRQHMRLCAPGAWVGVTVPNLAPPIVEKLARHYAPRTMATHNLSIMNGAAILGALTRAGLTDVSTGGTGGPHLSMAVESGHRTGALYRRFAGAWNLMAELLPFDALWHRTLWGLGRVPETQPQPESDSHQGNDPPTVRR